MSNTQTDEDATQDQLPENLQCPLTKGELFRDPVKIEAHMTIQPSNTYERRTIRRWLSQKNTNPMTGLPLSDDDLALAGSSRAC
jgi:hypothetical protein